MSFLHCRSCNFHDLNPSIVVALFFNCAHYISAYHISTALPVFFLSLSVFFPLSLFCQISYTDKVGESKPERGYIYGYLQSKNYQDLKPQSRETSFLPRIIMKPDCVLGLATGSSPVGTYKQLIEWYNKGDLDFSKVTTINLDEYKGLGPDNDQSYRYFMNTNLFDHVNIDKAHTFVPDGLGARPAEKPANFYNEIIRSHGGIDLRLFRSWKKWTYRF